MPTSIDSELNALQTTILEMVAYGASLAAIAEELCRHVERIAPAAICSIVRVENGRLQPLAAPQLSESFNASVRGLEIGPFVGSCGTAAFLGKDVEVEDIATDPRWAVAVDLAREHGLRACWSSPISARDGRVLGTFALYFREPRRPSAVERTIVERCTHLGAIALERHEIELRNHRLAFFDMLTGLANRASFNRRLEELCLREGPGFGLLLIDLDHLKIVNDTLGHATGDALLAEVAQRLSDHDAYRLGGDEFAVIVDPCDDRYDLSVAARGILDRLAVPLAHDGRSLLPHATIGGVMQEDGGTSAEMLCQNADFALYHGKERKRGGFTLYTAGMRTAISRRMETLRAIDRAVSEHRIIPYYQPIVRLDTAEIVGLEALARKKALNGRILAAGEFADAFTDPRIAAAITEEMLDRVALDAARWLAEGIDFQHIGFNVTTADFQRGDLHTRVATAFRAAGVPLRHIILEVNEAVFMGSGDLNVAREVEKLRGEGLRVALDDFGTGYASLTHLLDFPVDIMKIDKSFIVNLLDGGKSLAIVELLLSLTQKLGMTVVAEGVESPQHAEKLLELGCQLGQGYNYAMPCNAALTTEMLRHFAQYRPQGVPVPRADPDLPFNHRGSSAL